MANPPARTKAKPKLAVYKFASCDGCQLSLLDAEDALLAVAEAVTIADVVIGGPGIFLVVLMTITSATRIRRAIPAPVWQRLHTFGLYYVWFVYVACLVNSTSAKSHLYPAYHYVPFLALLGAVLLLRVTAAVQKWYRFSPQQ